MAPYLSRFYSGLTLFAGPFVYDSFFYTSYYPRFVQLQLPTGGTVQKALPEGVLQPGGRMTGDDDMGRFLMDLVDASTTRAIGTISIPWKSTDLLPVTIHVTGGTCDDKARIRHRERCRASEPHTSDEPERVDGMALFR